MSEASTVDNNVMFLPKSSAVGEVAVGFDTRGDDSDFCDHYTIRKPHHIHICELQQQKIIIM